MTLKLTYAGFNYVADIDGSYATADSLSDMQSSTASNSVALTDDYGIDPATSTVYGDYSAATTTGNTETIANLTATIKEAESDGLTVMVRPLIDFTYDASQASLLASDGTQYEDGDWRAYYKPTNVAQFFNSYDAIIVNEAKAAQAGGAQLFDIGTEIDQLTGSAYLSYWNKIISDVRAVYSGKITYSAISDDDLSPWQYGGGQPAAGTGDLTTQVSFWSQLDYIGIDEYAVISDANNGGANPDPTLAQLIAGWENTPTDSTTYAMTGGLSLIQYYENIASKLNKPLLFTEIGYNSAPDAASQPFYTSSNSYDPSLQANLYTAFFDAWAAEGNTSLQGVYIWDWEPNPAAVGAGTAPTWTPQGNPGAIQAVDVAYTASTTPTASPGTTTPDSYFWVTNGSGDWGNVANWEDVTTGANPAAIAPGTHDSVSINGGATQTEIISGLGNSSSLTVTNFVGLSGTFATGPLIAGTTSTAATLTVTGTLTAGSATVVNGTLTADKGGSVVVTGALTLGGSAATDPSDSQTVTAANGGKIRAGSIVLGQTEAYYTNGYLATDASSSIEVGTSGFVATGSITIDSGATLSGTGTIGSSIINNGALIAQNGVLYVEGTISGGGLTEIAAGSGLDVQSIAAVTFTSTGTLTIHPTTAAGATFPITGAVTGFVAGDMIDLANVPVTSTTYQSTGANSGSLTVFDGAVQLGTITLTGSYTAASFTLTTDAAGTGTDLGVAPAPSDFNGDGRSDLLLQNINGAIDISTAAGLSVTNAYSLGNPGPAWHVVGSADFNGDGQADILLQNDNGAIVDYLMNGTSYKAGYDLANLASSWHVRGTGDFNADGKADILVQNDNGAMVLLETNGTSLIAAPSIGTLPNGWEVVGVADFNGDKMPDILVQSTGGTLVDYTMNGATIASGAVVANLGAGWNVGGTGDYNGDGKADILLHNDVGSDVVLEMNGAVPTAAVSVGNPGVGYNTTVAGLDLNGDGSPDLVVQNSATSTLIGYTLNNTATITAGAVLGTPGVGWNAVGSNPITFIDGTGGTLSLADTAGPDQFNMTSYLAGIHTITGFDPAKDTLALNAAAFPNYATVQGNEGAYQGGTFIGLSSTAAIVIQGVTPNQLSSNNFVLR